MILTGLVAGPADADENLARPGYDSILLDGYIVTLEDAERLRAERVMAFDLPAREVRFERSITSERALKHRLAPLDLELPRSIRELYRIWHVPLPNGAAHTLTVPSGYGPARLIYHPVGPALSFSVAGVHRIANTNKPDGGASLSLSFGNSFESLGVALGLGFNDLSNLLDPDRLSLSFAVSRYLLDGVSLSVGGENLGVRVTDSRPSFYIAASVAFARGQGLFPLDGVFTLGAGSGRFGPQKRAGGEKGTHVFAALALEVHENVNAILDWNGRNLNLGLAFPVADTGLSMSVGVQDLTRYTGDGPRLMAALSLPLLRP